MMQRRALLKLLGLSGACAGLASSEIARVMAEGEADGPIRRVIFLSHCHGWPYDAWKMRPAGKGESTPWEVDLANMSIEEFSGPLAPLFPHRQRILPIDGLSLATAELDVEGNRHDTGWVHAWTGNWVDFSGVDTKSQSASIDQLLVEHIARPDRLPSLEISVDDIREPGRPISYGANGSRMPQESEPSRVWDRLFGPSTSPNGIATRQRGGLDYAYSEYQQLAPKLDANGRDKLDAHFELVQRLGDRLEGMANLSCDNKPMVPASFATYDERFDAFADLVGAAFACDATRIITLSLGELPTADFGADHITDDVHKGLAHQIYDEPAKHAAMADFLTMHTQQVARLISVLENIPEGDGSSVMDNTLIVWGSEMANGWHGYQHYCPVIIGGSWHFRTGRYLYWPHATPSQVLTPSGYSEVSGKPHQHVLVSAAQAMGVSTDHVGVDHVQGQTGENIICRGPLEGLT